MEDRTRKLFQVMDVKSGRKCMIGFEEYPSFAKRCKLKFGYPDESGVVFELEDENVEIDETAFYFYPNSTHIRMRLGSDDYKKPNLTKIRDTGANLGTRSSDEQDSKDGTTDAEHTYVSYKNKIDLSSSSDSIDEFPAIDKGSNKPTDTDNKLRRLFDIANIQSNFEDGQEGVQSSLC